MSRKKKKNNDKETGYVLILVFFISGIAIVASGNLLGLVILLAGLIILVAMFPSVREVIKSIAQGIERMIRERRERKTVIQHSIESTVIQRSEKLEEIIERVREFKPYKRPRREKQLEDMLMQHLRFFYNSLRTQQYYENTVIDGQIDRVGIELKYQPNESDFDRLFGQVEKYSRHLEHVIVLIAYARSREDVDHFRERLKRSNLADKTTVMSIP